MTAARARVLNALADGMARLKSEAAQEAGVSVGVIDGLIDEGTLETLVLPPEPVAQAPDPDHFLPDLSDEQNAAAQTLKEALNGGFSAMLIDGVTGSRQDRSLFRGRCRQHSQGASDTILMPEIALTTQFLNRFEARFGVRPAEWHSQLGSRKRAHMVCHFSECRLL